MRLEKLTKESVLKLKNRKIICYEKSVTYLEELEERWGLLVNVDFVVDDFVRNQGSFTVCNREISVVGTGILDSLKLVDHVMLITSDYFREGYEKLYGITNLSQQTDVIYYFANKETELEEKYRKLYESSPLEDIIVFRSGPHASSYVNGMDFGDNARALFEYMLKEGYNENYELVWLVKDPAEFRRYTEFKNVHFLAFDAGMSDKKEERDEYYRILCQAKFLFFTDAYGFARNCRKDQIRIQLWHGCGFKTRVNFVRCEKRYEYTTVISPLYAAIHADIYGLREEQVLVTGYAKHDWLFDGVEEETIKKIGIPLGKKRIFWLPTFRIAKESLAQLNEHSTESETGLPILYSRKQLEKVNELLGSNHMCLVVKLHPFQDRRKICCENLENIVLIDNDILLECDVQINQLLGIADAMISDYSSAAVDFLVLDRPLAFTLDDVEEYANSRGFVFDNIKEWLPGKEIFQIEDFCDFILEIANNQDLSREKRQKVAAKMLKYTDGQNGKRIVETFGIKKGKR